MARNILLTGIPRAGTTLAASLIDAEPNSVCLNEPEWQHPHPLLDAAGFAQAIQEDFPDIRKKLLAGVPLPDRRAEDGSALTNYYGNGMEKQFVMHPLVRKDLTADFTLAIKHNGPYLAVLPELIALESFEIRAVIRHPLPVLRSWRRLQLPISYGEMPNAAAYWKDLRNITESAAPILEKQVKMLELMFTRIVRHQSQLTLLRYETLLGNSDQISSHATEEDTEIMAMLTRHAPLAISMYKT
jgi:hypothetical protein